ncbi:MAG: hypothetical protein K2W97_00160 [Chthoniobacterales bacterium]|nr:hypothetical protein [Chthoniobacterales bacterium]
MVLCIPHLSFASDDDQEPTSYEAHLLSIKEYCRCLKGAASAEDSYRLYDMETMSREILQTASPEDQHPHFLYSVAEDIDPKSPMLNLTELDAMRCCNWIETSLPSSDNTPPNTEVGSYILHEDGSFEVNDAAQLHLVHHDDGTFEIISSVKKTTSPLMMPGLEKTDGNKGKWVRLFPDIGSETTANRREYDRVDDQYGSSSPQNRSIPMNITVPSLSNIVHNDNFDDDSLIGHTGNAHQEGSYIAIKDHLWCLPEIIKACLRSQEDRDLMAQARQKIRNPFGVGDSSSKK